MKLLFLTDNFPPETNAPARRTHEHCREWVKKGVEVTVITTAPNFPFGKVYKGYKNKFYQTEIIDGIKVIRVWSYMTQNQGVFLRVLDFLSFSITSFWVGLFVKTDLIVATSPQFFTAISGYFLSVFKRRPWVMEIRDLWPVFIDALGIISKKAILYKMLESAEMLLYKKSTSIIVVTDSFKKNLVERNIPSEKIAVFKNGVVSDFFTPQEKNIELIKKLKLENKFIVGYIGTFGLAHQLDFILDCAKKIKEDIYFVFVGSGAEQVNLYNKKENEKIDNVIFLPPVEKSEIKKYISIIDVALVNLKKTDTFKTVIPSKIFENAAMQKPILLGLEGESKEIIEKYKCGLCFEPENEKDFIEKLYLIKEKTQKNEYQEGCKKLAQEFDRKKIALEMLSFLREYRKKLNVTVISNYYYPEIGAAANRIQRMAENLKAKGNNVKIICPLPNYPKGKIFDDYKGKLRVREKINDIKILRHWIYPSASKNALLRFLSMLSFAFSMWISYFRLVFRTDVIIVQSPPLFVALSGLLLSKCLGVRNVLNVSDLHPLFLVESGYIKKGLFYQLLKRVEKLNYLLADKIMGQSQEIVDYIKKVKPKKPVLLYRNVPNYNAFPNREKSDNFRIVYAGLLGYGQGVLDICKNVDFKELGTELHIYGSGMEEVELRKYLDTVDKNIFFHGEVSSTEVRDYILKYDIAFVTLKTKIYGMFPSKTYELMQLGMPIIYVGKGEEAIEVIKKHDIGFYVYPEDYENMKEKIVAYKNMDKKTFKSISKNTLNAHKELFNLGLQIDNLNKFIQ